MNCLYEYNLFLKFNFIFFHLFLLVAIQSYVKKWEKSEKISPYM